MSSSGFATAREFVIKPSPRLLMLAAAAHVLAMVLPWLVLAWPYATGLGCVIVVSYGDLWRRQYSKRAIERVTQLPDGRWRLLQRDGKYFEGWLSPTSYVSPALVILNIRVGWRRRSLVILSDAMEGQSLRRLRVHLRMLTSSHSA